MHDDEALASALLATLETDVLPLMEAGVRAGNKAFGAAILRKDDLSVVVAGANREVENPLWHGEVSAIIAFYELAADRRPDPRACLFLTTHEPCSLCLSAITWAGFDNFHYLFGYDDTATTFHIPHDLAILREVFRLDGGGYARENAYWSAYAIDDLIARAGVDHLGSRRDKIAGQLMALSDIYQQGRSASGIPLS